MHIVRMVDAIYCAESITGGKQRINRLKMQLCSLITESANFPDKQSVTSNKILEAVITTQQHRGKCQTNCLFFITYIR